MRINQIAQQYTQQLNLQSRTQASTPPTAGLEVAQRANQARVTDAAKGALQASKVRDGVGAVSDGLGKARDLVKKAADPALSAADRKALQADLNKALASVDQGSKDQGSALADKTLTNKTYDTRRVTATAVDGLGKGASKQFTSVADLKKLDLTTASADQLAEAGKVLDKAKGQGEAQLATANAQVGRATGRLDTMNAVQNTLTGQNATDSKQSQALNALQALLQQQSSTVSPGSLFNTII